MVMIPTQEAIEYPSPGWHRATITQVEDIGRQKSEYGSGHRMMVDISYRMEDQKDSHGNPLVFCQGETNKIMTGNRSVKPSKLYKIVTEGLGIVVDMAKPFDSDVMLNRELWINVQYKRQKQAEYANIVGWTQRRPVIVEEVKEVARELAQEIADAEEER